MNKPELLRKIIEELEKKVALYAGAANAAHAEATDEENKAEDKYDTRGLEASYLAAGQSRQMAETAEALQQFIQLRPRAFSAGSPIDVGALVELESPTGRSLYFIGPAAGGTEIVLDKKTVLVLTPGSPLGRQLIGQTQGAGLKMKIGGVSSDYRVRSVS